MARVALVTGGTRGIGAAVAEALKNAGYDVAASYAGNDEAAKKFTERTGIRTYKFDVADFEACQGAVAQIEKDIGPVDVLVNNAGITRDGTMHRMTFDQWNAVLQTNLSSCFNMSRCVIDGMRERGFGRILNVLNTGAKAPPAEGAPTAVSRAAGMALTKILSAEGAADNVLVNALLVGKIRSAQWERRHAAAGGAESLEDYYVRVGSNLPMGRYGTAEEFANVACFLASDAGSYVTGTAINVDGGLAPVV